MSKNFDELFGEIVMILRRDYAGAELTGDRLDPRYYNQAVGQAWKDRRLDELLFLRYVSQMLACTGDRHLRLTLRPSAEYAPWQPGFFTRRYGDDLYITAVTGDDRLSVGDRITAVNGASPARQRRSIQKDFFYAREPEREDWHGLLKMAQVMDVTHADGTTERLELRRLPRTDAAPAVGIRETEKALILDLRNVPDFDEDELPSILSRVCREDIPLSALADTELFVNYTRLNCLVKAAGLRGVEGAEGFITELREKSGRGLLPENDDDGTVVRGLGDKPVIVLTDTWTRDGAETLALAAKRAGAVLMGRPTLGTIDLCGDVSLELDERFVLTWPTAVTKSAREGRGVLGKGVVPDVYVPWTPEECRRDVLMERALDYVE